MKQISPIYFPSVVQRDVVPCYLRVFLSCRGDGKTYTNETCSLAGIGLAFLYMTVLGFDNVTSGKIYR